MQFFETVVFQAEDDYFFAVYKLNPVLLAIVLLSIFFTLVLVPFLASIVWQDWYNPGPKRIFTHRIFSSIAFSGIGYLILTLVPDILRYFIGPFSERFCYFHYIIKNTFALQQVILLDVVFLARYIFIFWLKNPAAFQDKFWIYFTNMAVAGFSLMSQFIFALLPGRQPVIFYFCSGKDPNDDKYQNKKFNGIMVFFQIGTFVLVTIILLKIRIYKRSSNHLPTAAASASKIEVLESLLFNSATLFVLAEVTFVINKINILSPAELNLYPNNLYVNVFQLINPIVICGVAPLIYVWKHPNMNLIYKGIFRKFYECNT